MQNGLAAWEQTAEQLHVKLSDEYFKLETGLAYSKAKISSLERLSRQHAELFLQNFSAPRKLYLDCIATIAKAKTHNSLLRLHELRKEKICVKKIKFNNAPVCWTSWRTFAAQASDYERKTVFDSFINKVKFITPEITKYFDVSRKIYSKYDINPLQVYLEDHNISAETLRDILCKLGNGTKDKFKTEFRKYTKKFLGRTPQYYDDFYFMRNIVFKDLEEGFHVDAKQSVLKSLLELGFNPHIIKVDSVDRAQKFPSPFCSFVKIPDDIRVSYKMENPLNTAIALYHEFGHAAHAITINPQLPYHKKYVLSEGLTETFSIFLENLLSDENYLVQVLELPQNYAQELVKRIRFTEHYAIVFYVANSFLKIDQWEKNLTAKQMNEAYAQYLKEWTGLDVPGQYWQLHHILPESLMYVPSYLLAMARAHEITELLKKECGKWWWANKRAGDELRTVMMQGADSKVGDFQTLDIDSYLRPL
ncbi:MAG: hypothetical protein HY363_03075 [Candidatus Aenigmarchaeota archaeon]|nr:hypothetical protein [Candidatus Aenigmarchaeota archaeon]